MSVGRQGVERMFTPEPFGASASKQQPKRCCRQVLES